MRRICSIVLVGVACASSVGGPLAPPVGPVAPTGKTLVEVEPRTAINATNTPGDADSVFRITLPGSYYLEGNVAGVAAKSGVEIAAHGVTLDLMGFDLLGIAGSLDGVRVTLLGAQNITVKHGSTRGWGSDGLDLANADNIRVVDIVSMGNSGRGIYLGENATVSGCSAQANGNDGFALNSSGSIINCSARDNAGNGIVASLSSTIMNCNVQANVSDGISATRATITNCSAYLNGGRGIAAGSHSVISSCTASTNGLDGFSISAGCLLQHVTSASNGTAGTGAGIRATGGDNRIQDNNCVLNDTGIDLQAGGNFYVRNLCSGNTVNNWDVAIGNAGVVFIPTTNTSAFFGNSGGLPIGSTDPNVNWTY